jgi:hypothetical protein
MEPIAATGGPPGTAASCEPLCPAAAAGSSPGLADGAKSLHRDDVMRRGLREGGLVSRPIRANMRQRSKRGSRRYGARPSGTPTARRVGLRVTPPGRPRSRTRASLPQPARAARSRLARSPRRPQLQAAQDMLGSRDVPGRQRAGAVSVRRAPRPQDYSASCALKYSSAVRVFVCCSPERLTPRSLR